MLGAMLFASASLCVGLAWAFKDRGPMPMDITASGLLLYPQSSGSDDLAVLSLGLWLFLGVAVYAPISAWRGHGKRPLVLLYLITLVLFGMLVGLISMDVSWLFAASVGDVWPLISVLAAFFPLPWVAVYLLRVGAERLHS